MSIGFTLRAIARSCVVPVLAIAAASCGGGEAKAPLGPVAPAGGAVGAPCAAAGERLATALRATFGVR